MIINLFDDTFRHDTCSVAGKTPKHIEYVRDRNAWNGVTLFVDGYVRSPVVKEVQSRVKVAWLHEPQCLHPENYENIPADRFDFILTYHHEVLEKYSSAFYAPYGGVWIPKQYWGMRPKKKLCSMIIGDKMQTEGHRMRHEIADVVEPAGIVDFYGVRGTPIGYGWSHKMRVLSDYAFTIVCECCNQEGLFTEILLDCFATGTIPILWGLPDAGDFFNEDGILSFDSALHVGWLVGKLSMAFYEELLPAAQENLSLVEEYEITEDWLYEHALKEFA